MVDNKKENKEEAKVVPIGTSNEVKQDPAANIRIIEVKLIQSLMDNIYQRNKEDFDMWFALEATLIKNKPNVVNPEPNDKLKTGD